MQRTVRTQPVSKLGNTEKNKPGWVISLCSEKLTIFHAQRLQTTHAAMMFPHTLIDFLKVSAGWQLFGENKKPKKQDSSNILSDNINKALFHTILLVWGVFLPSLISGNGCSLMGFISVFFRFTHVQHKHPKMQLLRRSHLFHFHCPVRARVPCRFADQEDS